MATRRRFVPRMQRKREFGWTASNPVPFNVGTSAVSAVLLGAGDWTRGSGTSQNVTLYGIRGHIAMQCLGNVGSPPQLFAYIGVGDVGETVEDPDTITTYIEEDILWTYVALSRTGAISAQQDCIVAELNLKSRRKLTQDSAIFAVFQAGAADEWRVSVLARTCIRFS